jgi:mRNA (guanine-N7-)-methyltransferase
LLDKLLAREPGIRFDAVSCQFAIHYSWTSEADAKAALMNAARRLKPGGLFVGTTTDAYVMKKKLDAAEGATFGNSLYRVEFLNPDGPDGNPVPGPFDKTFKGRSPFNLKYR